MSRDFNGTSQYGTLDPFSAASTPCSLSAWVKASSTSGSAKAMLAICGDVSHYHLIGLSTSLNKWYCASRAGGSEAYAASATAPSITDWVHVCAVFASATSRVIYVNGANEGNNSTSASPTLSRLAVGIRSDGATPSATPAYFSGQLAEVAVYNAALEAGHVLSLAAGASPLVVAPSALVFYSRLAGESSPEANLRGGSVSLVGTPAKGASHPRIYHP